MQVPLRDTQWANNENDASARRPTQHDKSITPEPSNSSGVQTTPVAHRLRDETTTELETAAGPRAPPITRRPPAAAAQVRHACEHDKPPQKPALTQQQHTTQANNNAATGRPAAGVGITGDAATPSTERDAARDAQPLSATRASGQHVPAWHSTAQHAAGQATVA